MNRKALIKTDYRELLLRLFIISEDLSFILYNDFIDVFHLRRNEFGHTTLLESRIYSLFYVSKIVQQNKDLSILSNEFLEFSTSKINKQFAGYIGSINSIHKRIEQYNTITNKFDKSWIKTTLTQFQDNLLKSEDKKLLKVNDEEFDNESSEILEFLKKQEKNIDFITKGILEIMEFEILKNGNNIPLQSKVFLIRNAFESNKIFYGGNILFKELSKNSNMPKSSNPFFSLLKEIELNYESKTLEIKKSKKYLWKGIAKIYKIGFWKRMDYTIVKYFYDKKKDLGTFKDANGKTVTLIFPIGELIQKFMELHTGQFERTFREVMQYSDEMIESIKNGLSTEELEFSTFLLSDFYPNYLKGKFVNQSIDETYGKLFGLRITDLLVKIFGNYTYCKFENDLDIQEYQTSLYDYSKLNQESVNELDDNDDDFYGEEEEEVLEIDNNEIIQDLFFYGEAFNHLMASYNAANDGVQYKYPEPIKAENVFDVLLNFIFQFENFKKLTLPILELIKTFRDPKILKVITDNFGIEYRNLAYELSYRMEHFEKENNNNLLFHEHKILKNSPLLN